MELVDMLVRNLEKCINITNGNVYIVLGDNNVVGSTITNNISNTSTIKIKGKTADPDMENARAFINYLKEDKPSWYVPGEFIEKTIIHDKYVEMYGDISKPKFDSMFREKIFVGAKREMTDYVRVLKVKLLPFNELP